MRSVTLDGDVYDPSGSLSGGAKPSSSGFLLKIQELVNVRTELGVEQTKLDQISFSLDECMKAIANYNSIQNQVELKSHEYKLLEEQMMCDINAQVGCHSDVFFNA